MTGTVFVVATPIGNLEDISYRAVRVLGTVTLICAEDTRVTRKLLSRYDLHTPLTSFHQHTSEAKLASLLDRVSTGESIAVVSDAGTPGISDPGYDICRMALERGLPIVPIPGPSAAVTGLMACGLPTGRFTFEGFPPRNKSDRREFFAGLRSFRQTIVLYEAPTRLVATLLEIQDALGDCPACACRELTKLHEEFVRGTLSSLIEHFGTHAPRGEFTLIVTPLPPVEETNDMGATSLGEMATELVAAGMRPAQAAKALAATAGVTRSEAYAAVVLAVAARSDVGDA